MDLNKGCGSKFCVGSLVQQENTRRRLEDISAKMLSIYKDDSPKTLNDENNWLFVNNYSFN